MKRIVFYVREWLDEESFKFILKFSKFLGREPGKGTKFEFDVDRAHYNNVDVDEVISFLQDLDIEFESGSIEDIELLLLKPLIEVRIGRIGKDYVLIPSGYIRDYIKEYIEKGVLKYRRNEVVVNGKRITGYFVIEKPMYLFDIINTLQAKNVKIVYDVEIKKHIELPFKIIFKGSLREYQVEALEKWRKNSYRGVISLPTGAGKTIIALAALAELNVRTLIVTYTKEQMFQWLRKIEEFLEIPRASISTFYGESKRIAPITIATYSSAYRYIDMLSPYFSFLIVDEVHHLPADKFRYIAERAIAPYRMGLSATVIREDGKHEELFPLMGGIVYHRSFTDLASKGYLVNFDIITVKVELNPEEKLQYNELLKEYRKLVGSTPFDELVNLAKQGDENAMKALAIRSKLRYLVHNASAKIEAVKKIVENELDQGSKILIFTQYVEQAKRIAEAIGGYYITGDLEENARKYRLEAFRKGLVRILVLTTLGDEGIDIPDANVGIIVAGTSSRRQFIQRLGRLLRPAPGKTKAKLYEIIVKNTFEEYEAKRRKQIIDMLIN